MGIGKKARTWDRPRHTRHAWLTQPGPHNPPVQALIVGWTRRRGKWLAFVIWVSETGQIIQEWVDVDRLGPVPALERQMPGNPDYFPGW